MLPKSRNTNFARSRASKDKNFFVHHTELRDSPNPFFGVPAIRMRPIIQQKVLNKRGDLKVSPQRTIYMMNRSQEISVTDLNIQIRSPITVHGERAVTDFNQELSKYLNNHKAFFNHTGVSCVGIQNVKLNCVRAKLQ